uniref:Uncharacterized protein n=1 Tax=Sphaerodactylus townsendi TaxID=933632 RepID=A0ACB8F0F3_9SAUR
MVGNRSEEVIAEAHGEPGILAPGEAGWTGGKIRGCWTRTVAGGIGKLQEPGIGIVSCVITVANSYIRKWGLEQISIIPYLDYLEKLSGCLSSTEDSQCGIHL